MPEIPLPEGVMKFLRPKTYERRQTFKTLRSAAIAQSKEELRNRLATKPQMTPIEEQMGIYAERLEPQVREAVIYLRKLGYSTMISGFWDKDYHQIIQMDNALTTATKDRLRQMGVSV